MIHYRYPEALIGIVSLVVKVSAWLFSLEPQPGVGLRASLSGESMQARMCVSIEGESMLVKTLGKQK